MAKDMTQDLRSFLELLKKEGQLLVIEEEVDPHLEIAEIHRRIIQRGGPALLFTKVKGSAFPVTTNLFGNAQRLELAFGRRPGNFVREMVEFAESIMPPTVGKIWEKRRLLTETMKVGISEKKRGSILESRQTPVQLSKIPFLTSWHSDGGPFLTLPLVYTEHPGDKRHNLGMYRIQRHSETTTGIHWQIHKGGGYHYHEAEKAGRALPLTIFLGGPPALMISAIAPLPEDLPELLLASLLLGKKLPVVKDPLGGHRLIAEAEFAIKGHVPPFRRHPEGPFGDHYGYDSLKHDYPIFEVSHLYHRKDAIYPATVVGHPRQEDFFIGDFLQDLLSPLFPLVMKGIKSLKTFGETGFHCLTAARVSDRYPREAFAMGLRILGEGQLSLTKFLILTDGSLDISNFAELWCHVLARVEWSRDLFVFSNTSQDTLDYTGPEVNKGSKAMLMGLGKEPRRELTKHFNGQLPAGCSNPIVFLPGTLVIEGPGYETKTDLAKLLTEHDDFRDFQIILLVDDSRQATESMQEFLWTFFTRFEPAADIYGRSEAVHRFHVGLESPIAIDCRMKPWYTKVLEVDAETREKVNNKLAKFIPPHLR